MLSIDQITCHFGARAVLRDVSFRVGEAERVAVVGPNGAGKSTLLRIVAGDQNPDDGAVSKPGDTRVGYLPQETDFNSDRPLMEELLSVFRKERKAFAEMRRLEEDMAKVDHESEEFDRIAHRYDFLQSEIDRLDGYTIESRAGETAAGLGFSNEDLERPCHAFSGGWRKRILLAKLLLEKPDFLLLDEPTNHLDLETMLWVENWIRSARCGVLMVSHERAFMDRLCDGILELARGQGIWYKGNYTRYLELRAERREHQQRSFENQQQKIREAEKTIDRFRAKATKAAMAQSMIKKLDKMERLEPPPPEEKAIHFQFPPAMRPNKETLTMTGVSKSYGDRRVLKPFDLTIYRGDRVALVGMNGAGKSTLIRMMAGTESLTQGERQVGSQIELSYFAQTEDEMIGAEQSVLDDMKSAAPLDQGASARDILGAFLFQGDDVEKPVKVLSGGEKTRLRLAKMLFSRANLLLMDEPTNHLDLASRMTLESALQRFEGAIVLVSHDRVFLDNVVNRVVEIRDGELHNYIGNFSDYLSATEGHGYMPDSLTSSLRDNGSKSDSGTARPTQDAAALGQVADDESVKPASRKQRLTDYEQRKALARRRGKLETKVREFENRAAELEEQLERVEATMAEPEVATNPDRLRELTKEQEQTQEELNQTYWEWEKAGKELEEIEGEM